jgi:asparagine synthase (glutamine-hydrolysing)
MILKGRSFHETFILDKKDGATTAGGSASAAFGYRMGPAGGAAEDGVWADWKWENDRFELRSDPRGFYPIYYYQDQNAFGVSNSVAKLIQAGCSTALDDAAIAVFLRLGFYIGDDTPFRAIRALPPGAVLTWDSRGFHLESNRPRTGASGSPLSRDAAVRAYGELFQSTIERFHGDGEKVAVPLSGGRDSRHILFALLKANRRPDACVTLRHIPPRPDEDARIASEVARFDALDHVLIPCATELLDVELEKNLLTNFCADEHAWFMPLRSYLAKNSIAEVFDGIGGDVLSAGLLLDEERLQLYEKNSLAELADNILGPEGYIHKMIRPDSRRAWGRELAAVRLISELEKHRGSPNPVGQFYFWNRTRREIATSSWGILNEGRHVFAPYLSEDIYSFLAGLPASYFLDHAFHTEAIAGHYPEHAHLPYETKTSTASRSGRRSIAGYGWDAARYCLLSESAVPHVNASFFLPRIAKGLIDTNSGTNLHALFNKAIYLAQLENLRNGAARH